MKPAIRTSGPRPWRGHDVPGALDRIQGYMHQDASLAYNTIEDAIGAYLSDMPRSDRQIVREFLKPVLDGRYSTAQLKSLWWNAGGIQPKSAKDARNLFEVILHDLSKDQDT
jgi:hypothetical protein